MRIPCRRRDKGSSPRAEKFGVLRTADHSVLQRKEANSATITDTLSWYNGEEFTKLSRVVTEANFFNDNLLTIMRIRQIL